MPFYGIGGSRKCVFLVCGVLKMHFCMCGSQKCHLLYVGGLENAVYYMWGVPKMPFLVCWALINAIFFACGSSENVSFCMSGSRMSLFYVGVSKISKFHPSIFLYGRVFRDTAIKYWALVKFKHKNRFINFILYVVLILVSQTSSF